MAAGSDNNQQTSSSLGVRGILAVPEATWRIQPLSKPIQEEHSLLHTHALKKVHLITLTNQLPEPQLLVQISYKLYSLIQDCFRLPEVSEALAYSPHTGLATQSVLWQGLGSAGFVVVGAIVSTGLLLSPHRRSRWVAPHRDTVVRLHTPQPGAWPSDSRSAEAPASPYSLFLLGLTSAMRVPSAERVSIQVPCSDTIFFSRSTIDRPSASYRCFLPPVLVKEVAVLGLSM